MQRFAFVLGLLLLGSLNTLTAQITAKGPGASSLSSELPVLHTNEWSIYADEESQTYYIDFEQLAVNVNDVVVRDQSGSVLWQEEVFDLPVNTIYELDFSAYRAGAYVIELRAYTGIIRKTIDHKGASAGF